MPSYHSTTFSSTDGFRSERDRLRIGSAREVFAVWGGDFRERWWNATGRKRQRLPSSLVIENPRQHVDAAFTPASLASDFRSTLATSRQLKQKCLNTAAFRRS